MLLALTLALAAQDLHTFRGRALHADGSPAAGAAVCQVALGPDSEMRGLLRVTTVSADGTFRWVQTTDAAVVPLVLLVIGEGGIGSGSADGPTTTEVRLARPAPLRVELVEDGEPVADRALRLHPVDSWWSGADLERPDLWPDEGLRALFRGYCEARTGADGSAVLPRVPRGAGFGPWRLLIGARSIPVELTEGSEVLRIDLGELRTATVYGRVTDERGRAIAGAEVSARWHGLEPFESPQLLRTVSDSEGRYRLEDVPLERDKAALRVEAADHARLDVHPLLFSGDEAIEWDLALWRVAPIRGRVVEPDGTPVPRVVVEAQRPWGRGARASVEADASGRFTFEGLLAGPYALRLRAARGQVLVPTQPVYASPGEEDVLVRANVFDAQTSPVRIRFVEQGSDERVDPGYAVLVPRGAPYESPVRYPVDPLHPTTVPRGEWVLIAGGEALHPEHVPVSVGPGPADVRVEMHYPVTARVAGRVLFPGEPAPPAAWVRAEWSPRVEGVGAQHYGWRAVEASGHFDLGPVYEGAVVLHLSAAGWTGTRRVDLGPLGELDVELVAQRGAELELVPDGYTPSARFVLEVAAEGEAWQTVGEQVIGDGERELFTSTLAPGAWRWRVRIERAWRRGQRPAVIDMVSGRVRLIEGERARIVVPVSLPAYD